MKTCRVCKIPKPNSEFNKSSRDRQQSLCKKCQSEYGKEWRKKNRDKNRGYCKKYYSGNKHKWRARFYQSKYGMTIQEIDELLKSQNGICPICRTAFKNTKLMSLDHDHTTGKLREILCNKCNTALGLLDEKIDRFERAIQYINKWNTICVQHS